MYIRTDLVNGRADPQETERRMARNSFLQMQKLADGERHMCSDMFSEGTLVEEDQLRLEVVGRIFRGCG